MGDSEVYTAICPLQMWNEYGFTSYDVSTSGQNLPYGFSLLKRALAKQKPRVVVFETNSLYLKFSLGDALFRQLEDAFPVLEYHNRWKSLTASDFAGAPQATWTDDFKGFRLRKDANAADTTGYGAPSEEVEEVPLNNRLLMRRMVDYCRARNAVPVFVSVPAPKNWTTARHNGIQQFADELGVVFYDLNLAHEQMGIDWQNDTYDKGDHLNYQGAVKVSGHLGALLAGEHKLVDRRGDSSYASWNDAYERLLKQV